MNRPTNGWWWIVAVVILSWAAFIYKATTTPKQSAFSKLLVERSDADAALVTVTVTDGAHPPDYANAEWTFSDAVQDTTEFCNPQGQCVTLGQVRAVWAGATVFYDDGRVEEGKR